VKAEDRIGKIRFVGNEVTQEETMLLEMTVHEGSPLDIKKIEQSIQNIMDLGIFEKVSYYLEKNAPDEDTDLVITVVEPYYWYVLPTFRFNDNSALELGVRLRWNNLFGYNHRLLVTAENKGTRSGVNEYASGINYIFPRFLLSRYALSLKFSTEQRLDNDNALGDQRENKSDYGFNVRKWLNDKGVSTGPFYGFGLVYETQTNVAVNPLEQSDGDFSNIIYGFQLGSDTRHKYEFQRSGGLIEYNISFSSDFVNQQLTYRKLNIVSQKEVSNINYLVSVGYSNNDVLGNPAFSLGGNSTLRGYTKDAFQGNIFYRASVEYLTRYGHSPLVRKVAFVDLGEIHDSLDEFDISSIKLGTGVGLRWKARHFVNIDFRLDVAYGVESGEFRLVLGSHNTF